MLSVAAVRFGTGRLLPNTAAQAEPLFHSRAVVVLDVESGRLLLARQPNLKVQPGPLTHMLTALTAVRGATLDEKVLVSRQAAAHPGVRVGLVRGAELPLGILLRAFLFAGASDAGRAIVEHVAGSDAAFLRQLAETARALGLRETVVVSPYGADLPGQWTTAYDMALAARAVVQHASLGPLTAERRARVVWDDLDRELLQRNSFLWRYPGATGVKSGYSADAGYVLAAAARRGGKHLIAVVLGAEKAEARFDDARRALDFAFAHYAQLLKAPLADALPYEVAPGDTLSGIASRSGVSVDELRSWNDVVDPDRLAVGTRLWVPLVAHRRPNV